MENRLQNLYQLQLNYWKEKNIHFFGIEPRNWDELNYDEVNKFLEEDKEKYWNTENPCELLKLIMSKDKKLLEDYNKMIPGSLKLKLNYISECIDVLGSIYKVKKGENIEEERVILSIPLPNDNLTWTISRSKYVPRVSVIKDYNFLKAYDNYIVQNDIWKYNIFSNKFEINEKYKNSNFFKSPYENISKNTRLFLETVIKEELTEENFESSLIKSYDIIKNISQNSIYRFIFAHLDNYFDMIKNGNNYSSLSKNIPLSIGRLFLKDNEKGYENPGNKLILGKSSLFNLENFKTSIYKVNDYYHFTYNDSSLFFDAFKTSTSKSAGKNRLLLDNVIVENGVLNIIKDGKKYNMYEVMLNPSIQDRSLSMISWSPFCYHNDPKRIMMTAKLSTQSVPIFGEYDSFTNRIKARVVFADLEGFSYADAIIISESFANKLKSKEIKKVTINKKEINSEAFNIISTKLNNGDKELTFWEFKSLFPKRDELKFKNYQNINVIKYEKRSDNILVLHIYYEIPFEIGDKITNLHGAKGVCGLILPDDKMPRLINDIGNFKSGPMDIVLSGYSVMRRGSFGQLFEAWANASNIKFEEKEDFIIKAKEKYKDQMKEFSKKSLIEYNNEVSIKPCGILDIIRLYHHAPSKTSRSFLKTNNTKMLKLEEMVKLNLAANGAKNILKELSIRSTKKHSQSLSIIKNMMENGEIPENINPKLSFAIILKGMGLDIKLDGESLIPNGSNGLIDQNMIYQTNDEIDLEKIKDFQEDNLEDININNFQ